MYMYMYIIINIYITHVHAEKDTYSSFIKQWMKHIVTFLSFFALLFVTKYQVNPLM